MWLKNREKSYGETPNQEFRCLAIGLNMDNLHPLRAANRKAMQDSSTYTMKCSYKV